MICVCHINLCNSVSWSVSCAASAHYDTSASLKEIVSDCAQVCNLSVWCCKCCLYTHTRSYTNIDVHAYVSFYALLILDCVYMFMHVFCLGTPTETHTQMILHRLPETYVLQTRVCTRVDRCPLIYTFRIQCCLPLILARVKPSAHVQLYVVEEVVRQLLTAEGGPQGSTLHKSGFTHFSLPLILTLIYPSAQAQMCVLCPL